MSLHRITANSDEYLRVNSACASITVRGVFRVDNANLKAGYDCALTKEKFNSKYIQSITTFHGTPAVDSTVREGFRVGGVGVPIGIGARHGQGVYSTTMPSFAARFARGRRLLMCDLCVTNRTRIVGHIHVQPDSALILPAYVMET